MKNMKNSVIWLISIVIMIVINLVMISLFFNEDDAEQTNDTTNIVSSGGFQSDNSITQSDVSVEVTITDVQKESEPPVPEFDLEQDPNCPLPWEQLVVQKYCDYPMRGKIVSQHPIESVSLIITRTDKSGSKPKIYTCRYDTTQKIRVCDLSDGTNELSGKSLDKMTNLKELEKGKYKIELSVKNTQTEQTLYTGSFTVDWLNYKRLTPANFRDNYAYALEFFGGDYARFMFGYTLSKENDRHLVVEKEWRKKYLTAVKVIGKIGYIHIDMVPYLEKAQTYIDTTHIRVQGNGHDSGVILLSSIAETFAGAFVPRFVRNDDYVSHHSFGTALDINAYTYPNTLNLANQEVIRREVSENLVYNGIKSENGVDYYDFQYNGESKKYVADVPREIQNYLLYELAFYRAGFGWGFYYTHTCDAMHYTMTELDPALHEADDTGLRKVFEYIPKPAVPPTEQ